MNKCILLVTFFLISLFAEAQYFNLAGCIVDEQNEPLQGVSIEVLSPDSVSLGKGAVTNNGGFFSFQLPKGEYLFKCSFLGFEPLYKEFNLEKDSDIGHVKLKESSTNLDEVVVIANNIRTYGNREEIFLTQMDVKIASSALQAIGYLPQFAYDALNNSIKTANRQDVLILINEKISNSQELLSLHPEEISKIVYYSQPPSRFADYNVGGVIEIYLKRTKEKTYSAYVNTKNSFTTGYGTNTVSLSRTDSIHKLSFAYFIDYRKLDDNRVNQEFAYNFPDESIRNIYDGLPGKYNGRYHIGRIDYQKYHQGNYMFSTSIEYRKNPGLEEFEQLYSNTTWNTENNGNSFKILTSDYDAFSWDLYYSKELNEDRKLLFNMVNTYYLSESDNQLWRINSTDESIDYNYNNHFKNKSYSLIMESLYTSTLGKTGNINVGARFNLKTLNQQYNRSTSDNLEQYTGYIYGDYSNTWEKLGYTVGIGVENTYYHQDESSGNHNFLVLKPSISTNYNINDNNSLRYNASVNSSIPQIGLLLDNDVYLDERYVSRGNPDLKPFYYVENKIQYLYNIAKLYFSTSMFDRYRIKPTMPILAFEDDLVVKTVDKASNDHIFGGDINIRWNLSGWFALQPYYAYTKFNYRTPLSKINYDSHVYGLTLYFTIKNIQAVVGGMLPYKTPDGDFMVETGGFVSSSLDWKYKNTSLGVQYIHNPYPSLTTADSDQFKLRDEIVWHNFRNLFALTFTYRFKKGTVSNQGKKVLTNTDYDSGLIKDNTAK